jgi:hypothetical protein
MERDRTIHLGRQLKARLELDRRLMQEMTALEPLRIHWPLITGYVCEDPRFVDFLINNEIRVDGNETFPGYAEIKHTDGCCSNEGGIIYEYYHYAPTGEDDPKSQHDDWMRASCSPEVFETLLMLPMLDDLGQDIECAPLEIYDVKMRECIYADIQSMSE